MAGNGHPLARQGLDRHGLPLPSAPWTRVHPLVHLREVTLYVYMGAGFLMSVPNMLVGEQPATPLNSTREGLHLIMACLQMLG